jgi:ABC-type antimicrobial peptide transport system permease subunit
VVGVVSNSHYRGIIERPSLQFYVPLLQSGDDGRVGYAGTLEVRAMPGRTAAVAGAVRAELERAAPPGTVAWVRTLSDQLNPEFRNWRLGAQLFSLAGLLALLVAGVGIYGNVSYSLSQRTHEMGVRIALGARTANIVRLVLGEGLRVLAVGVALGVALVFAGGRLVASMLYGVTPHDPAVLAVVVVVLVVAAVGAALGPAVRAARADPIDSLRTD